MQCFGEGEWRIEEVKVMKYLGTIINKAESCEDAVDGRIEFTC